MAKKTLTTHVPSAKSLLTPKVGGFGGSLIDNNLNAFFQDFFRDVDIMTNGPEYDIKDLGDNKYQVSISVPGFTEDELDVRVSDDMLIIEGNKEENYEDNNSYLRKGIRQESFEKRLSLDNTTTVDNASLHNGILKVDITKHDPEEKGQKQITINTS